MSREKQIEEMAKITKAHCELDNQCGSCHWETCNECLAEALHNAGYRKQGWISVKERLPEERELVFVYDTDTECVRWAIYNSTAEIWTSKRFTHWMPLPEAPKMKGGAE